MVMELHWILMFSVRLHVARAANEVDKPGRMTSHTLAVEIAVSNREQVCLVPRLISMVQGPFNC